MELQKIRIKVQQYTVELFVVNLSLLGYNNYESSDDMNKKGFTLVELMGILVILGLILVITVPSITKTLKNSQSNELKEYQKTLCLAARSYIEVSGTTNKTVSVTVLKNKGYLESNFKKPDSVSKSYKNVTVKNDGSCTCS